VPKNSNSAHSRIMTAILENMPKEAEVTRIEFEGPRLAIYVKNVNLLMEQSHVVTDIVNLLHKRIVIRSDPSIRVPEKQAEDAIGKLIPAEAAITSTNFDPSLGEVIIEAKKPGLAIGKASSVRITPLGGSREVGRSCIMVEANESAVLLDCGINPGSREPGRAFPRLDTDDFRIDKLDAVIISHAHLDHCGLVPFLYKYGYDGPVYCSEPTSVLMTLLQLDYLDVTSREGGYTPFDQKNVREVVMHTIPLKYGVVTDVAPDMKLTLHNAGHILGSSIVHLHIGEGLHNLVYTSDYKFGKTMLLEPASIVFPRVETLITECTYGGQGDVMPNRSTVESRLVSTVNESFKKGGKVLIPVPAVGRAQEIMMVLDNQMKNGSLMEAPIYIDGMISEATAIHTAYPEYLSKEIRDKILHQDVNPFQSDYFVNVNHPSEREGIIAGGPSVILATSGMLEGGPAVDYLRLMAADERNTVIFVSYQIEGTLGSRIRNGTKDITLFGPKGKVEAVKLALTVESLEGFSGHSDRNQLIEFVRRISSRPSRVIVNHGEYRKCDQIAGGISALFRIKATAPENLETIRLR
jgi:KH/beta-lactamase-domain protein